MTNLIIPKQRPKQILSLNELNSHQRLGIDFDGTLVGHKHSQILQQYIVTNPEKEFHLITFRSHGRQWDITEDLRESVLHETHVRITGRHFVQVHNMSDEDFTAYNGAIRQPEFYLWKATKCKEIGCTILIDDMADFLHEYCVAHGVACFHPDDFMFLAEED